MNKPNKYIKNTLKGLAVLFVIFIPKIVLAYEPEWVKNIKSAVMSGISEGFGSAISLAGDALYELLAVLASVALWLVSWIAWAAGKLLNFAIDISIIKFSELANLPFITESWKIMRDLANIAFIFILLYIAISTILRINSQDAKKMLSYVIIVALLVNFSAVFTRIAIDVSNVIAITFYNKIGPNNSGPIDVSTILIKGLDSAQYFVGANATNPSASFPTVSGILLNTLGSIVLMIIVAFVMLSAAMLFIIRALMLLFLIIIAPVAFLGFALPKLGSRLSGPWLKELTSNLLFAPAFMILFFITMKIADGRSELHKLGGEGFTGGIIIYIFLIGFLIASIIVAKQLGARGGAGAEKFAFKGLKLGGAFAGMTTLGAGARIGQATVGNLAKATANNQTFKNKVGGNRFFGQKATAFVKGVGNSSFDVRRNKAVQGATQGYIGKGATTPEERKKEKERKEKEHATYLADGDSKLEEARDKEKEKKEKEKKKTIVDNKINKTSSEVDSLDTRLSHLDQNVIDVENEIKQLGQQKIKNAQNPAEVATIEKEISNKEDIIKNLKDQAEQVKTDKKNKNQILTSLQAEQSNLAVEITNLEQEVNNVLAESRTGTYIERIEQPNIVLRWTSTRNPKTRKDHAEKIRKYVIKDPEEQKKGDSDEIWRERIEKIAKGFEKEDNKKEEKT